MNDKSQQIDSDHTTARMPMHVTQPRILLLDDEKSNRIVLKSIMEGEGYAVLHTDDGREALDMMADQHVDLIIQDLRMPKMDGLIFLKSVKQKFPDVPSIVLTAFGTFETAVEAMRLGAYTHLSKPFDTGGMREIVARALKRRTIVRDLPSGLQYADIVSNTSEMAHISSLIDRVALTDSTVLITGESGTGKDLVARAIHFASLRAKKSFFPVYCGAFTETLPESEIFGHMKDFFKSADRGTLFLDEIGELTPPMQAKLLCVLESRSPNLVRRTKETTVDVRIIAATNRKLGQMAIDGQFREDLYYRINVVTIELPPLRDREGDIPLLAGHFVAKFAKRMGKQVVGIDDEVIENMLSYSWPGNVRQLENTMESAVAISRGDRITMANFALPVTPLREPPDSVVLEPSLVNVPTTLPVNVPMTPLVLPENGFDLEKHMLDHRRAFILQALERSNWNLTKAGKLLNISFRMIRYQVSKLGIEAPNDSSE